MKRRISALPTRPLRRRRPRPALLTLRAHRRAYDRAGAETKARALAAAGAVLFDLRRGLTARAARNRARQRQRGAL